MTEIGRKAVLSNKNKRLIEKTPEQIIACGKRIRTLRDAMRYSTREFQTTFGINASRLKNWEQGTNNGLSADGAEKFIRICQSEGILCTWDWLFYGKGPDPLTEVKAKNAAPAIAQELRLFRKLYHNTVDTIIKDNAMEPFFYKGDFVAGLKQFEKDIDKLIGEHCIVQFETGETYVRKLMKGKNPGLHTLAGTNAASAIKEMKDVKLFSAACIIFWRHPD